MNNDSSPAKVRLTDGLGPLVATAWKYARAYGSGLAFNLPPCDAGPDDEWQLNPQRLYALSDEDVAAVNAARKERASKALRRLDLCRCDHNEYCQHCYPVEFRPGGVWGGPNVADKRPEGSA